MRPPRDTSIVRRLVVVTLAVGLVIGGFGVAMVQRAEVDELRRAAGAGTLSTAQRTATLIDGRIEALLDQLTLLAAQPAIASLDPLAGTQLAVVLRVSDDLDDLRLYDRRGEPVAAASSVELLEADALPDNHLAVELAREGPSVRIVDDGPLPALELTVAVEDPPGRLVGALIARTPLQLLTHEADARLLSSDATGLLVAFDGRIVGHRQLDLVLARADYDTAFELAEGAPVTVTDFGDGRGRVIVASARSRLMPLWMIVELPEQQALATSERAGFDLTVVVSAVVIAILAAVIAATRRFLAPLRPLAGAVERFGAGDRDVRVDERAGSGEVRVVATGFNRMAERLAQRQRELEEAERAARHSEERLRLMVEGVEDYAIFLLTEDGEIRSWNTGAQRLLGATQEQATGRHLRAFFDPDDPPDDPWAAASRWGRGESEGWYRRDDGSRFFAHAVVTALRDERDQPSGFAVVLHDTTERRAARMAMQSALEREREAAEDLRQVNQLKDGFLAMAAHELQTPVAAIMGANEILKDPEGLPDDDREHLRGAIEQHAGDMRDIVQRLLDFSRLQAGRVRFDPQPTDLREALLAQTRRLAHALDEHDVVVEAPSTTVELDERALQHIVGNLLSNAAKFSDPGSRIELRGHVDDEHVEISVTDQGEGISSADREHVFELFGQSDTERSTARGTGVGLAIVQRYTQLLGGVVTLDTEVGRGSTFTVRLPRELPDGVSRATAER